MLKEKILVVEDEGSYREYLTSHLEETGFSVSAASDGASALDMFTDEEFDLVLLDLRLPGTDGLDVLKQFKDYSPETQIVMMTAYGLVQSAVEAIKRGAFDYITKENLNPDMLNLTVRKALEQRRLKRENEQLRAEIGQKYTFENIIGKSKAMRDVFQKIQRIAPFKSTILITGESGTGKEMISRAIYLNSPHYNRTFVAVNCGAIPEMLLESELFGHVKGSFTGAIRTKKGLFEEADGGTIFLDEISELPLNLQVKLLRVLQDQKIRRIGDTTEILIDVRVIAATSRDLYRDAREGRFREDLFYRLNIIPVSLPPLRERTEDVPLLVNHFLRKYMAEQEGIGVSPEAMQQLMQYRWPGNVRELENIIERAVVLSDSKTLTPQALPPELQHIGEDFHVQVPEECLSIKQTLKTLVPAVEQELIRRALKQTSNNRTRAARLLEISHRSLLYKLKEMKECQR
ncbi:sigma-54 dependent transcriptional regulator [bacterium]|nr:sigma-54 dependent transcriptional regulator [bacterium]